VPCFTGENRASLITAILSSEPPPVHTIQPLLPPAVDHLVRKCLAKEPDDRWQSAHDLAIELKWIAEGGSQSTLSEKVMPRSGTRERLAWAIAVALFLITLALLYNFTGFMQKQKPAYLQQFSVLLPQDATPDPWGSLAISPA